MAIITARIRIRRGTLSDWTTENPTPKLGEMCWVRDSGTEGPDGTTWYGLKIGDGVTDFNTLPFAAFGDGEAMSAAIGTGGNLAALAGLTGSADMLPYFTGSAAMDLTLLTAFGRDVIAMTNAAEMLSLLGVESIGLSLLGMATPGGTRFFRVNNDGTVTARTAAEMRTDLGAGSVNGLATLDSGGKVPTTQLPDTVLGQLEYVSGWNATTNTPTIPPASSANKGEFYQVSVAVGSGHGHANVPNVAFDVGDWLLSNGTSWEKFDNSDAVVSVAGRIGNIVLTSADLTDRTALGAQWITMATPAGVRFARINADGTLTLRSASELLTDLGATSLGNALFALATPAGVRYVRINADGTVSLRTAAEMRTDLGATDLGNAYFTLATPAGPRFGRMNADGTLSQRTADELLQDLGVLKAKTTNNQNDFTTSPTSISGLSVSVAANTEYNGYINLEWTSSNNSGTITPSISVPAGATVTGYVQRVLAGNTVSNSGLGGSGAAIGTANTRCFMILHFKVVTGGTAGTVQAQLATSSGHTLTCYDGAYMELQAV